MSQRPRRTNSKPNLDLEQDWAFAIDAKVLAPWNGDILRSVVIKQLNSNFNRMMYPLSDR